MKEQPTSDPRDVEFQAIGALIRAGQESGLLAELIWSFGMDRAGGSSVPEAVEYAFCWRKWIDASKNPNREAEMSDSHSADEQLVHRVCSWIAEEIELVTGSKYLDKCKQCPAKVDTLYGEGQQVCFGRASELIELVRSGS